MGALSGQYSLSAWTPDVFIDPLREKFGELWDVFIACHYEDDSSDPNDYDVTLYSDTYRFNTTADVTDATKETVMNQQAEAGQIQFRHGIQIVPEEGFFGTYFSCKTVKLIPTGGSFSYDGVDFHVVPRPQLGPEFIHGGGTINNGWT